MEQTNLTLPTKEQIEWEQEVTLCTSSEAEKIIGVKRSSLKKIVESGELSTDFYYIVDYNIQKYSIKQGRRSKYLFIEDKLRQVVKEYKDISWISKQYGIPHSKVCKVIKNNNDELKKVGQRYHVESVLRMIKLKGGRSLPRSYSSDYLSVATKAFIKNYIDHVSSNSSNITVNEIVISKSSFSNKEIALKHQRELENIIFQLILARNGHLFKFGDFGQIDIKEDLLETIDFTFDFDIFDSRDLKNLEKLVATSTFHQRVQYLKKLLSYWIMVRESDLRILMLKGTLTAEEERIKERNMNLIRSNIMSAFNQVGNNRSIKFEDEESNSLFLSRGEYVQLFTHVFKTFGLQSACLLAVTFILGMRRSEASKLAVEDFNIDVEGYLVPDKDGYGRLNFPAEKSKGGYGPSSLLFGTLIPPYVVKLINIYLRDCIYADYPYEKHKEYAGKQFKTKYSVKTYATGHGYLFRPNNYDPDTPYHAASLSVKMKRFKDHITFLDKERMEKLSLHDGRHSLNEWMATARLENFGLQDYRDWAAKLQMRHNRKKGSKKDVSKDAYRDNANANLERLNKYKRIIHQSINFPMNLDDLKYWEDKYGYNTAVNCDLSKFNDFTSRDINIEHRVDPMEEVKKRIIEIEKELNVSKNTPHDVSIKEWLQARKILAEELKLQKQSLSRV